MNRKDFGQLLASLRQDLGKTQFELAELAQVENAVISQMERGVKKYFEPELLFALANVLQLTTLERREFFLASSGLDERQIVRQPTPSATTDAFHPSKILKKMEEFLGQVHVPAFLNDVYSDIIAVNQSMLAFFNVPPAMLENASSTPGGFNSIRVVFGRELVGRTHVAENWDAYAMTSMRAFREISFRYRTKPYFRYLMNAFRNPDEYPFFDRFWKMVSSMEQDKDSNMDRFSYHHSDLGDVNYYSSSTVMITAYGELFLVQYLPLDDRTSQVFEQLKQNTGGAVIQLAPWPNKLMPQGGYK